MNPNDSPVCRRCSSDGMITRFAPRRHCASYMEKDSHIRRVAFLGNYLPRRCGIATFTTDLCESVASAFPDTQCFAVPVNDTGRRRVGKECRSRWSPYH